MSDKAQRTEEPTQRRLSKARDEGQFPAAKELVSALQFGFFVALLGSGASSWLTGFQTTAHSLWSTALTADVTAALVQHMAWQIAIRHLAPLAAAGLVLAFASIAI